MYNGQIGMYNSYQLTPQQRIQQYDQQQMMNQYQQQMYPQQPQSVYGNQHQPMLKGRAVTNFDEAKASIIDLDGSVHVFTDLANNKIYTKQIMLDGTAQMHTYKLDVQHVNKKEDETNSRLFVYKDEIETLKTELNELKLQIDSIKNREVVLNESNANNANVKSSKK